MIYKIQIRNDYNEFKQMFLTANSKSELARRTFAQYHITKDRLEILEEYDDNLNLIKSHVNHLNDIDKDLLQKSKELFYNSVRKCEPYKSEYMQRHKMSAIDINTSEDVFKLLKKYKNVRVCWELTDKRGQHKHYALVR